LGFRPIPHWATAEANRTPKLVAVSRGLGVRNVRKDWRRGDREEGKVEGKPGKG